MPEEHELVYVGTAQSGAEIWQCPRCEHRMLTRWSPSFKAEVVAEGDPRVTHSGSMGAAANAPLTPGEQTWLSDLGIAWDPSAP